MFGKNKNIQIIKTPNFEKLIENYGKKNNFSSDSSNVNKEKIINRFKYHEYLKKQFQEELDLLKYQYNINLNLNQRMIENDRSRNY